MKVKGTIVELEQPRARIVDAPGFVRVYGWKRELATERGQQIEHWAAPDDVEEPEHA